MYNDTNYACEAEENDFTEALIDHFEARPDTGFEDYIEHHDMLIPAELVDDLPF